MTLRPTPVRPMYDHRPRLLSRWENEAITAQCIHTAYPDDKTPVPLRLTKED